MLGYIWEIVRQVFISKFITKNVGKRRLPFSPKGDFKQLNSRDFLIVGLFLVRFVINLCWERRPDFEIFK